MNLKLINDDVIFKTKKYNRLIINNKKTQNCITINPFSVEHYNDVDLFNIKIYCDIHNIKLKVLSTMNYLPVNSQYADELILVESASHLSGIYSDDHFSHLNASEFDKNWPNFLEVDFYQASPDRLDRKPKEEKVKKIYDSITLEQLNYFIKNKTTLIRKSSYDLFKKNISQLPKNIVLAEIKNIYKNLIKTLHNKKIGDMPIIGLDFEFQKKLINNFGHHYMSFQILGSIYLNWNIIAAGGSARLFSMLPTKNILLIAKDLYGNDDKIAPKKIGWINKNCNFPWTGNQIGDRWSINDIDLINISNQVKSI